MCLVQQAMRLVSPRAAQEPISEAPMVHVWHADHHDTVVTQRLSMPAQHGPWVAQVLKYVAINDAIDWPVQIERQLIALDVYRSHLIQSPRGEFRCRWIG